MSVWGVQRRLLPFLAVAVVVSLEVHRAVLPPVVGWPAKGVSRRRRDVVFVMFLVCVGSPSEGGAGGRLLFTVYV